MEQILIAPCGMNCSLCVAYQFGAKDLNKKGFRKRYCPGCIPRGKNCTHMGDQCQLLAEGSIRFCTECGDFPCKRLNVLDKRYKTKYHMSMIENLKCINEHGIKTFLTTQKANWACPVCGEMICCHNGLCLNCSMDKLQQNKKYRWNEDA